MSAFDPEQTSPLANVAAMCDSALLTLYASVARRPSNPCDTLKMTVGGTHFLMMAWPRLQPTWRRPLSLCSAMVRKKGII